MDFNKQYEEIKARLDNVPTETIAKKEYVIYKDENGDAIEFKVYKNDDYLGNFLADEMEGRFGKSWSNHVVGNLDLGTDEFPLDHKVQDVNVVSESSDESIVEESVKNYKVIVTTKTDGTIVASAPVDDAGNKLDVTIKEFGDDYDDAVSFYNSNKGS